LMGWGGVRGTAWLVAARMKDWGISLSPVGGWAFPPSQENRFNYYSPCTTQSQS